MSRGSGSNVDVSVNYPFKYIAVLKFDIPGSFECLCFQHSRRGKEKTLGFSLVYVQLEEHFSSLTMIISQLFIQCGSNTVILGMRPPRPNTVRYKFRRGCLIPAETDETNSLHDPMYRASVSLTAVHLLV